MQNECVADSSVLTVTQLFQKKERVLPPRGVEGSAVDGIGGGAFLWFFLVAVDKKEQEEGFFKSLTMTHFLLRMNSGTIPSMHVTLTWDLIVIVFFAVIVAYSFIMGKNESVKIVIASYIAIVAVQAIGNLLELALGPSQSVMQMLGLSISKDILSTVKLVLFVATIIFLAIRGGFEMDYAKDIEGIWDTVLTGLFGLTTAGLLLSALLTFIAARPILDNTLAAAPLLTPLLTQSRLVQIMVDYQNLWFCLPAILLLGVGIVNNRKE